MTFSTSMPALLIGVGFLLFALELLLNEEPNNDLNGRNLRRRLQYLDPRTVTIKPLQPPQFQPQPSVKLSLVTSFWAVPKAKGSGSSSATNPHRKEMEAALLANIHNPHFDQVAVFLDGVSEESHCGHFMLGVIEKLAAFEKFQEVDPVSKLTCVNVHGGQPTYYEMFQNTLHEAVVGDVVVLANADQAFDHTIAKARFLNPEVLAVVGTRGFSDKMPSDTRYFYDILVGTDYLTNNNVKQENPGEFNGDMCDSKFSFDTWIVHKRKLENLKEEDFKRMNGKNEKVHFHMNEQGAENAALWAVQQSYSFTSMYNACDMIHTWHFHLTPKSHKIRDIPWIGYSFKEAVEHGDRFLWTPAPSVPKPWGGYKIGRGPHPYPLRDPKCVQETNCFLS